MNHSINFFALCLLLLTLSTVQAQSLEYTLDLPQGFSENENWMEVYKTKMGPGLSTAWLADQMAEGASMYSADREKGFILLTETAIDDTESMLDEMETVITYHDGTRLYPAGEAQAFNEIGFVINYTGTLAGQKVSARKICLLSPDGSSVVTICSLTADPFANESVTLKAGNELAGEVAFMNNGWEATAQARK